MPVQAAVMVPLANLTELSSHEQQLLSGQSKHVGVKKTQVGESLPLIAGHFTNERAFAVHNLVMRQRQHEVLGETVDRTKSKLVVVVLAIDGIKLKIFQGVVHP